MSHADYPSEDAEMMITPPPTPPIEIESENEGDDNDNNCWDGEQGQLSLCDQIKEIIEALNDIRSQLAEQNEYLDVLTEQYIVSESEGESESQSENESPAPHIVFTDREWDSEAASETDTESESEQWEDSFEALQEEELFRFPDDVFHAASVKEWSREAKLAESNEQNRYLLGFMVAAVFYLPMGLLTSFFGMRLFNPNGSADASHTPFITVLLILSLTTYAFAAGAVWIVQDEDGIKTIVGSWRPILSNRPIQRPKGPSLLRRRSKAWDVAM
ncbi:hypothetical protein BJX76DRAFT_360671 [Aspergillus varians]